MCVNRLLMLSISLSANRKLLVVKFLGSQSHTLIFNFMCVGGSVFLTPMLFEGQLLFYPDSLNFITFFWILIYYKRNSFQLDTVKMLCKIHAFIIQGCSIPMPKDRKTYLEMALYFGILKYITK